MSREVYLLNDAEDLDKIKGLYNKNKLIITHLTSVYVRCEQKYKIKIIDLNSLIDDKFLKTNLKNLLFKFVKILKKLDNNNNTDLYFSLFRYDTLVDYFGVYALNYSLKKILKKDDKLILIGNFKNQSNFITSKDSELFLKYFLKKIKAKYKKKVNDDNHIKKNLSFLELLKNYTKKIIIILINFKFYIRSLFSSKKNIIILSSNFKKKLKGFNCFYFQNNFILKNNNLTELKKTEEKNFEDNLFINKMSNYINQNNFIFTDKLKKFNSFCEKFKIQKIVWFEPKINPTIESTLISNSMKSGYKVIGFQHGGTYGMHSKKSISNYMHTLSDFIFCNKFYGYVKLDIDRSTISKKLKKKVSEFNSSRTFTIQKNNLVFKAEKNKILYPINLSNSLMRPKFVSTSSEVLKYQTSILDYLKKNKLNCVIKSYPNISSDFVKMSYPIFEKIEENYKFLIEKHKNFPKSIEFYQPDLILIDMISTPLYEAVTYNCDIICFRQTITKYDDKFLKLLNKRVYIAKSISEFVYYLNLYKTGKLKKKRDKSFYNNFILKKN